MTETTDLFGNSAGSSQQSLFGEDENRLQAPSQSFTPKIDEVRRRLEKLLRTLRSASELPWPEREARMWQTVFPNMTKWLPDEEALQLRLAFDQELERLKAA